MSDHPILMATLQAENAHLRSERDEALRRVERLEEELNDLRKGTGGEVAPPLADGHETGEALQ